MNIDKVRELLESNKNERGMKHWEKWNIPWTSYGIGLTQLKKIAKQVGRDHELALKLWKQDNYDMITLATMVDEPSKVTRKQVEEQVKSLQFWMLAHSYCSNLMPKVSFQKELAEEWISEENDIKRRIAYLLIYNIARDYKSLDVAWFETHIDHIKENLQSEENFVKDAMNNALIMMGSRSKALHDRALLAARFIGKVDVDYGDNSCVALDAVSHLSSERIKKKLS
ncbi:MAG: DNA alkylation repair protein [Bacteroidales bacterium]|nr:DNA alkylation repair protein [Bacteroidales bacterium]